MTKGERFYVGNHLYESSLGRIDAHIDRGFVILSAAKSFPADVEEERFKNLKRKVKELDLGFIELLGAWVDFETKEKSYEKSLCVPYYENYGIFDKFLNNLITIARGFEQKAIIYGKDKKIYLYWLESEKVDDLGEFHLDRLSEAYGMLAKERYEGRAFAFQGVRRPTNLIEAIGMKKEGYLIDVFFVLK